MTLKITVVIPTYNRLEMLKQAIDSVRQQKHRVSEIIVVDDGSTDQTVSWCLSQPDISLLSTMRCGPSGARNLGVNQAQHDWIAFLDSDDVWDEHHLQKAMEVVKRYPHCRFALFNFQLTDQALVKRPGLQGFVKAFPAFRGSPRLFSQLFRLERRTDVWHGPAQAQALLGNWLQPSGLIIQRSLFLQAGGFNESLWRCEDMDLLLKLVCLSPATLVLTPSYRWRQGQSDSLAADAHTLDLKRTGLRIMASTGFGVASKNRRYLPLWICSVAWMAGDLGLTTLLRKIRRLESYPQIQSAVQTLISILNITIPILLAQKYVRTDFANYRMFAIYLSSVSALSLTSGLWSLIPFWKTQSSGEAKIASAWKLQCVAGVLATGYILLLSLSKGGLMDHQFNTCLAVSAGFLLPSIFLEQHLCYARRGLLVSCVVAMVEFMRSAFMLALAWRGIPLVLVISMIPAFLSIRAISLYLINQRCSPLKATSISRQSLRLALWESMPIGFASAMTTLSSVFDRLFLSRRLSPDQFSTIAAGSMSLPMIMLLEQALVQNSLPQIAKCIQHQKLPETTQIISGIIEKISIFAIPFTAFLVIFAPEILYLIFSGRYSDAVTTFRIFSLSNLLSCVPPDVISRALGLSRRILFFSCLTATLTVTAVVTGFAIFGTYVGIGFGLLANLFVRVSFLTSDLKRINSPTIQIIPSKSILLQILASVFVLVIMRIASHQLNLYPIETIILSVISLLPLLPRNISNMTRDPSEAQEVDHEKK